MYKRQVFKVRPLKQVIEDNTTLLDMSSTIGRLIQKKFNVFIDPTFIPSQHRVCFRTEGFNKNEVSFQFPNPIGGSDSDFTRTTVLFNCVPREDDDQNTKMDALEDFAEEVSDLVLSGYDTANQIDSIYFGLLGFKHSPRFANIEYFHDLRSNSFKTKVLSHRISTSHRPTFKQRFGARIARLILKSGDSGDCDTLTSFLYDVELDGEVIREDYSPARLGGRYTRLPAEYAIVEYDCVQQAYNVRVEEGFSARKCSEEDNPPTPTGGACCPSDTNQCTDVPDAASCAGNYLGDGTSCATLGSSACSPASAISNFFARNTGLNG